MATTKPPGFSDLLRRSRHTLGLTQEELAERAGVSARLISALESGAPHRPRKDTLRLLAEALELSADEETAFLAAARRPEVLSHPHGLDQSAEHVGAVSASRSAVQTFLVADIRGYTRFTQDQGDEAAAQLAVRFAELVEEAVAPWEGRVVETRGDEVLVAFTSARGALQAAVAVQRHLAVARAAEPTLALEVGMGLDAGEAVPVKAGYRGGALNLAARLCALAAGGEILASEGVVHLARTTAGLDFAGRGEVQVQGLTTPVRVIQIAAEGTLPEELPALQPIFAAHHAGLPAQLTHFIGREREAGEIQRLLSREDVRLLTLSGPGGIGKTRLAVEVAGRAAEQFADGVYFISLESVTEAELVPSTVAASLGMKEPRDQSVTETLIRQLQNKRLLLILDSFEHLLDSALFVGDLLSSCAGLTVLVTSRALLHLAAEHVYEVPPLSLPSPSQGLDPRAASGSDATTLFVKRAEAVGLGFELTDENAPLIADICARLDGLPLAIELAAARTRLFSPAALLRRLQSRLAVLTGGPRDYPLRHHTLRDTIDWSYRLLDETQQHLFARLSVFVGGFTLEAAAAVCADGDAPASNMLEQLALLADKSLIRTQREGDEPRFAMLDTIREYALELLESQGDAADIRRRHAEAFLSYAVHAAKQITGSQPDIWLTRLESELGNLRAALQWTWRAGENEIGLGLTTGLTPFWLERGYASEGLAWLDRFLDDESDGPPGTGTWREDQPDMRRLHAAARELAADLANRVGNSGRAQAEATAAVDLYRALGDTEHVARSLRSLAEAEQRRGHMPTALMHYRESYALHRESGHDWEAAHVWNEMRIAGAPDSDPATRAALEEHWDLLLNIMSSLPATDPYHPVALGQYAFHLQLYEQAWQLLESGRAIAQRAGNKQQLGIALNMLGEIALLQGDLDKAAEYFDASEPMRRDTEDAQGLMFTLRNRARVAFLLDDFPGASRRFEESLGLVQKLEDYRGVADVLRNLGDVARAQGELDEAADRYRESVVRAQQLEDQGRMAAALNGLAGVCSVRGHHEKAARIFATADTSDEAKSLTNLIDHTRDIDEVRDALGEAAFQRAWSMGHALPLQEAASEAWSD